MAFLQAIMPFNYQSFMWSSISLIIFALVMPLAQAQTLRIGGQVKNLENGEPLAGVHLLSNSNVLLGQTDAYGYFTLVLAPVQDTAVEIFFLNLGFEKKSIHVHENDSFQLIYLTPRTQEVKEIQIKKYRENLSSYSLSVEKAKKIPMLGGEADIIKAFQYLPGVAAGSEGTSALYVRGGSPDQNLFLLDQIPLYYVSHIGGFVSSFDPQMISSIQLFKGSFPPKYAGRLSSVVDIQMKSGHQLKQSRTISLGLLSTKYQQEGPFPKDSSWTYLFSLRRFNFDLLTRMLARLDSGGAAKAGYTFYDGNVKLVKRYANNAQLSMFYFDGRDRIFVEAKERNQNDISTKYVNNTQWGNRLGGIQFSQPLKSKMLLQLTLGSTNFYYSTGTQSAIIEGNNADLSAFKFTSRVGDVLLKSTLSMALKPQVRLEVGTSTIYHVFKPANVALTTTNSTVYLQTKVQAFEQGVFGQLKWSLNDHFKLNTGAVLNSYWVSDTFFLSFEPRATLTFTSEKGGIWQLGFSKMQQNLHYASYSGSSLPSDFWLPATKEMQPEKAIQANLTYCKDLNLKTVPLVLTLEAFHKQMCSLIDFKEGVSFYTMNGLSEKLETNGKGWVYGFECLLEKNTGPTTGWIAYTWSKNFRQFDQINAGLSYPFKYDRRHNVSVVLNHEINKRINLNATWVYSTGTSLTLGQGVYDQLDIVNSVAYGEEMFNLAPAQIYTSKNGFRLPAYHRLDLSIQLKKGTIKGERIWSFVVYNAYNRMNPFFLFYDQNTQGVNTLQQFTLFPLIPAFNYQLRLK